LKAYYSILPKELNDNRKTLEAIDDVGFDGVEISLDYPFCYREFVNEEAIERVEEKGLLYSFHMPWRDFALASPIEPIRKSSLSELMNCCRLISRFNPTYIVLHVSTNQSHCGFNHRECLEAGRKSLESIERWCRSRDLEALVETVPDRCCSGEDQLPYLINNFSHIYVCLDLPHLLERRLKKVGILYDYPSIIRDQAPVVLEKLRLIHIHKLKRDKKTGLLVDHMMPEQHELDEILDTLEELNLTRKIKALVFEVFHERSLRENMKRLRQLVRRVHGID
jgi:sugar phosphate isomerase/epimerase